MEVLLKDADIHSFSDKDVYLIRLVILWTLGSSCFYLLRYKLYSKSNTSITSNINQCKLGYSLAVGY